MNTHDEELLLRSDTENDVEMSDGQQEAVRETRSRKKVTTVSSRGRRKMPTPARQNRASALTNIDIKRIATEVAGLFKSTVQDEVQKALAVERREMETMSSGKTTKSTDKTSEAIQIEVNTNSFDECVGPARIKNPYAHYVYSRDRTKTDYKLTKNSRFDLWVDLLRGELNQEKLLDIIDENVKPYRIFSNEEMEERKANTRFLIINKIDALYHNTVVNVDEPREMLKLIMEQKRAEQNIGSAALRHIINTMKFEKEKEKIHEFNLKFDDLIRRHAMTAAGMSDEEKRDAYQNALKEAFPTIETIVLSRRGAITYDELKLVTATLEESEKMGQIQQGNQMTTAMYSNLYKTGNSFRGRRGSRGYRFRGNRGGNRGRREIGRPSRCYACGDTGHRATECQNQMIKCYECNDFKGHTAKNCPKRRTRIAQERRRGRNFNESNKYRNFYERKTGARKQTTERSAQAHVAITHHGKMTSNDNKGKNFIFHLTWLSDTGASENVVNDASVFKRIIKSKEKRYIVSANDDERADVLIEGRGEIMLKFTSTGEIITLHDVLYASRITENLLSLRKFIDEGFDFHANNEKLTVFDRKTKEVLFAGDYEKPVWIVETEVYNSDDTSVLPYVNKTKSVFNEILDSEGACHMVETRSQKRKREEERMKGDNDANENETKNIDDCETELVTMNDDELRNLTEKGGKFENQTIQNDIRQDEGMWWHVKLGHPSLYYLQQLSSRCEVLKDVKFDSRILDCDVCIRAKMTKLPFKEI
jgi:hypothetical protein